MLSGLVPAMLKGSEPAALAFPEKKIELLPPLSLADIGRVKPSETFNEGRRFFHRPAPQALSSARPRSQMPVFVPKDDVNWHLRILALDPTVDFKLIVKDPGPETVK